MKLIATLFLVTLIIVKSEASSDYDFSKQIQEKYGDLYTGEAFLTAENSVNDLWF